MKILFVEIICFKKIIFSEVNVSVPLKTRSNGTYYAHAFVSPKGRIAGVGPKQLEDS